MKWNFGLSVVGSKTKMSTKQSFEPYVHTDGQSHDHYFVDVKSKYIYFIKSHNGRRIKFTTKEKFPNIVKAKKYANQEFQKRLGLKKKVVRKLIKEELNLWVKVKESEGLDYDTLNNIRRAAFQIKAYWGDKLPDEITVDEAPLWYAWWKKNHPDISIENAAKYMNAFCRYLSQKVVAGIPLLVGAPKFQDPDRKQALAIRKKRQERILDTMDFNRIYGAAWDLEHRILCLFMYTMATRIEETLELDFETSILLDRDVPVYRWTIGQNKADLYGEHALPSILIPMLKRLRMKRQLEGTTKLFPQTLDNTKPLKEQQIDWNTWRKRANLKFHWTSKVFRHTCLSLLLNDPKLPQATICKQYRVSLSVALDTYVKTTHEAMMLLKDAIKVEVVDL